MSELKIIIDAPEIAEALQALALAIAAHAETTPIGTMLGAAPTNTTCASVEEGIPTPTETAPATPAAPVAPAIPTAAPQYTLEMLAKAGTALVDAGKTAEVTALLARYGVDVLTSLDPAMYGAVAMDLRALGASI